MLLTMMITPSQAEYTKGLHRAQKQGKMRLPWWDDLSVNWLSVVILAGIVLVAGTIAATAAVGTSDQSVLASRGTGPYPLALAAAVLTVAYFGLALQYFQLRFARRGIMYFGLFLFIVWVLPLLAGSIQSMASGPLGSEAASYPIFALSPVAGIGMIYTIGDDRWRIPCRPAPSPRSCSSPSSSTTCSIGARRRVMRSVFAATVEKEQERPSWSSWSAVAGGGVEWVFSDTPSRCSNDHDHRIGDRSS